MTDDVAPATAKDRGATSGTLMIDRPLGYRRAAALLRPPGGASGRAIYWLMIAPAVAMLTILYLYPLSRVLWISFTEPAPGFGNYILLFTSSGIQRALVTTIRIASMTTAIALVLGYAVAYAMRTASSRLQRWMLFLVLVPFWISVLVRAFAWVTLLRSEGVINTALMDMGIIHAPLAMVRNEFGVVVGMVHFMLPYAILTLYANMRGIDARLVNAARGLGASRWQAFIKVFLPLTKPGLIGAGILVFILSLGFYVTPAILGGGRTVMIAEYISVQINDTVRWGVGTMLATTLMLSVLAAVWALSRLVDIRQLFGSK
jgi:putative spermidine/putrescine transport system permease protein